jgi:hypothetical protein
MAKYIYSPVAMCNDSFEPTIIVTNLGTNILTSLDLVYQIENPNGLVDEFP